MFLEIKNLNKMFDENNGVKDINLNVEEGEFITLLGPSGCGKTTILNILGGFLKEDSGEIILSNEDISELPPEKRPVSTVFQNYALFSHYNVLENVAYGLRYFKKMKKKDAEILATEFIETVGLKGYEKSSVNKLSGGQQQRVALARGLATGPKLLLLDEPLSNLDAALRLKMRYEIKEIQKKYKITMIFVTHDQDEALSMSDRIVVMDKGRIVQIGSPKEIYLTPVNRYVASFVGKSNYIEENGKSYLVRPEEIDIKRDDNGRYRVLSEVFLGAESEVKVVDEASNIIEARVTGRERDFKEGERVSLNILNRYELK